MRAVAAAAEMANPRLDLAVQRPTTAPPRPTPAPPQPTPIPPPGSDIDGGNRPSPMSHERRDAKTMSPEKHSDKTSAQTKVVQSDVSQDTKNDSFQACTVLSSSAMDCESKRQTVLSPDGHIYGRDEYDCSDMQPEDIQRICRMIAAITPLSHPNIVRCFGNVLSGDKSNFQVFREFVPCTLRTVVNALRREVPLATVRCWTRQLVEGVGFLHQHGVVHRAIKGDHLLITPDSILKILVCFDCCVSNDDATAQDGRWCALDSLDEVKSVDAVLFSAPELIAGNNEHDRCRAKCDIWSVGCTVVEMLTGRPPWPEYFKCDAAMYAVINSAGLPEQMPDTPDGQLRDFLVKCFDDSPHRRPSAAELLGHPFLASPAIRAR
jgi:serine/threonine protein kinase